MPLETYRHPREKVVTVIVWTVTGGHAGSADTRRLAAEEATAAAVDQLRTHAPGRVGWDGPAASAVTMRVEDTEAQLLPSYDRAGRLDLDATTRAAHRLRDTLLDGAAAEGGAW